MTLRNLQVFVKVAECGKMSTAAKQLYVSQSSVSQAISDIEKEFDIVLFDRIGKRLCITPLGKQLLQHARKAISYQDSITEWLRLNSNFKSLRIGASVTVGSTILSNILRELEVACPGIEIYAYVGNTNSIVEKLLSAELDIALVEGEVNDPHINVHVAMDDHLVLTCGRGHKFYGRDNISIRELDGEKLLLREKGSGTRAQLVEKLVEHGINYTVVWECASADSIKHGIINGNGISVMSERLIINEFNSGDIWACSIDELPFHRNFSVISYSGKIPTSTMKLFSEAVTKYSENETRLHHLKRSGESDS